MRIALLGPPGVGKGTVAGYISKEFGVPHLSTGEMLRAEVARQSLMGKEAQGYMDSGALVPDELVVRILDLRMGAEDCKAGFVLDGFPRTAAQADVLSETMKRGQVELDAAVLLQAGEDVVAGRLSGRRQCRACSAIYHLRNHPPEKEGVCDRCGGELYQRSDDAEGTVRERLVAYRKESGPVIAYYEERGLLRKVFAEGALDATLKGMREALPHSQ